MHFPLTIPTDREFDAVGFGTNAVDFLIGVPEYPGFNSKIEISGYVQAAGGEVATTMAGLSRLGLRTAYAGRFGDDAAGEFGIRTLVDDGVDTRYAQCVADTKTQIAFIVIDERSGERTVMWQRDAGLAYTADEAPVAAAKLARVLHMTPHDAGACLAMARSARAVGTIVSVDVDNIFDGFEDVLRNVDILMVSSDFPARFLEIADARPALSELRSRYGCSLVGVTLGSSGSLMLAGDGKFIESPGFDVPNGCKDTTGAGDAFRAGLLFGLLSGRSIEESARSANLVAALKCREIGARTALPKRDELEQFLRKI